MANLIAPHTTMIHSVWPSNRGAMALADPPLSTTTFKAISGHVYNASNAPVVGATVVLYRQADDLKVGTTTSGAAGVYSLPRRSDDTATYYTVAYSLVNGSVQIHGVSNRGLVPA